MDSKPIVLGREMASAQSAEGARLAVGGPTPSPLAGKAYDAERGEFNLTALVESALDSELIQLVEAWLASGGDERERVRCALSLEDNYTLVQFAKRMAVRALNERSGRPCELGLTALAMIDESRIDPRDASWAAGLLNHAARRQHGEAAGVFDRALTGATTEMTNILRAAMGSTLEEWGYQEWRTSSGIGLIRSGWAPYEPTVDLAAVAHHIASKILCSRYLVEIEVATELPSVWFAKSRRERAAELLEGARGIVAIEGFLRTGAQVASGQMFVTWIAELPFPAECAQLVADVGDGETGDGRFVVAVSAGPLLAVLVAGSCQVGVEPLESLASLRALGSRMREVLIENYAE